MGVFSDYVDAYSDLNTAASTASNNKAWGQYVDRHSDLINAWNSLSQEEKTRWGTKGNWGQNHYNTSGARENRVVPFFYGDTSPGSPAVTSKEEWGQMHWDRHGKNENRIVPNTPKLNYSNGRLSIASNALIGAGATQKYNDIINTLNNSSGGNYKTIMTNLGKSLDDVSFNDLFNGGSVSAIDSFYIEKKVGSPWDASSQGVQPPTGGFDSAYYEKNYPNAIAEWNSAQKVTVKGHSFKDLDITSRYNKDTYLLQHYTNVGRHAGYRGNLPTEADIANKYTETLTDYEKQLYRDQVLGITNKNGKDVIDLAIPQYDEKGNLINEKDVNTLLERNIAGVLTSESSRQEKQLQTLAQDVLQQSINELKKAREKESSLMFMKNLPTYSEIMNINTTLSNSLLGDAAFGGMLGFIDPKRTMQKDLEKAIGGVTGISSSNATIYNWQKWFDDTLLKRYDEFKSELDTRTPEEIKAYQDQAKSDAEKYKEQLKTNPQTEKPLLLQKAEQYKLDINNADQFKSLLLKVDQDTQKEFVNSFVNGYIKPRFDQSKSMDEFISYLDVKEEEQNIFQSQSVINKLKQVAETRSNAMLSFYKTAETLNKNFDSDFYLDPINKTTKELTSAQKLAYETQKSIVNQDFEAAKQGKSSRGINWATEAYRYGYETTYKTDPKVFARLHYQTLGSTGQIKDAQGNSIILDPADNILGYNELQKKIQEITQELVLRKDLYGDTAFMKFVTPEEFADSVLASVSPEKNKEEWAKIVEKLGLTEEQATLDNVKEYLIESFRTGAAKDIRESIKYLNEQQEALTQERLGASYIQREGDKKDLTAAPKTKLYDLFKSAGFAGSEDDFYTSFMPDVDREEQESLGNLLAGKGMEGLGVDYSDPFSAFTKISSFLDEPETQKTTSNTSNASKSSYFNIFGGDEDELPNKSKTAQSILGEFTSMFKGFS